MADDDLNILVDACRAFKQPIWIRGSTAYVLSKDSRSKSIVESVPPLGDLDLVVRDEQPAESMRRVGDVLERYRTYVPASRFIHVDVFYEHLPVSGDSPIGNVTIYGLPEVAIGRDDQQGNGWAAMRSSQDHQIRAEVQLKAKATLFRDFLYLLRMSQRHAELRKVTSEVAALLHRQRPDTIGSRTRAEGGARELARIDKALVKHVLLSELKGESRRMTEYLSLDWLHRFGSHLTELSQTILFSEDYWMHAPAMAYSVEGMVREFGEPTEATTLVNEEMEMLEEKLSPRVMAIKQRLTPYLRITLLTPDDPECCRYRDFSQGIAELAFRDSHGHSLMDVALFEGPDKFYSIHAQASAGFGARSLRTDPGLMSMLNHGSLGKARLMGVRFQ